MDAVLCAYCGSNFSSGGHSKECPIYVMTDCIGDDCNDPLCGYEPEVCQHCADYGHACWFTCDYAVEHCCSWREE